MTAASGRRRLLFVVNDAAFFLSHRLPIALAARDAGFDVHVATAPNTGEAGVEKAGLPFHPIPLGRRSASPMQEARSIASLVALFRRLRPEIVHLVTIKPNLYGSLAARIARVPRVVNAISGLGYIFISTGWRATARRAAVAAAYRVALRHPSKRVIFQNPDDRDEFILRGWLRSEDAALIRGSGVDIGAFTPMPEPSGVPLVVLASRMLKDKGVRELVDAARTLKSRGVAARFVLVGAVDPGNPSSLTEAELQRWVTEGIVEWSGRREDMPAVFAQANLVALPSYREGLPKVLIEAAASGRAIVTTDVPGCREVVEDGSNGLLVSAKSVEPLADALERLIRDPALRAAMGRRGRERAVQEFSLESVIRQTLELYE